MKMLTLILFCSFGLFPHFAHADSGSEVVKIANGVNQIDFTGDGVPDLIISGHRENNNAHSFEVVSFYISIEHVWNVVPIFVEGKEKFQVDISGGADCVLHDFRLLKGGANQPATLIVGDREFGASFADSAKVTFTFYALKPNFRDASKQEWGPTMAFVKSKVMVSKADYCDVGAAFKNELELGAM